MTNARNKVLFICALGLAVMSVWLSVKRGEVTERADAVTAERDAIERDRDHLAKLLTQSEDELRDTIAGFEWCENDRQRMMDARGCEHECESWQLDWYDCFYGGMEKRTLITDYQICLDELAACERTEDNNG